MKIRIATLLLLLMSFLNQMTAQKCHLHINAGQSNAELIEDDIELVWSNTFNRSNNCNYMHYETVHIGDGGTFINQHLNPNAGHPNAPIGNQSQGLLWDYNIHKIEEAKEVLTNKGCQKIEISLSWYQGEADAFWTNSNYGQTYNWYLAALQYLYNDFAQYLNDYSFPMFIIEINSSQNLLLFEDAIDHAGESFARGNEQVLYYQIPNLGNSASPIYQAFNSKTGETEDIYGKGQGVHTKDWFSEQYTIPALQQWLETKIDCSEFSCPNVSSIVNTSKLFCEGEIIHWHGEEITSEGEYSKTIINDKGCSIQYNLELREHGESYNCDCLNRSFVDFEEGEMGIWNSIGGNYSKLNTQTRFSESGKRSWLLKYNSDEKSSLFTDNLNYESDELELTFILHPHGTETGDKLHIEIGTDGKFETFKTFIGGQDFTNRERQTINLAINLNGNNQLRFRAETDEVNDNLFLDNIHIQECNVNLSTNPCDLNSFIDFENNSLGIWRSPRNSSLSSLYQNEIFASSGTNSWLIRGDDIEKSYLITDVLDFNESIELSFHAFPIGMESGDKFHIEVGQGSDFKIVKTYTTGIELQNQDPEEIRIVINEPGYESLRIRSETSSPTNDYIFIDDLKVTQCQSSKCHLHINGGQSNAFLILDDLEQVWDENLRGGAGCDYDFFEIVPISKGATFISQHINPNIQRPDSLNDLELESYWQRNKTRIENSYVDLQNKGCTDISVTMSWYQGEGDASYSNSNNDAMYDWYLAALNYIREDYSSILDQSSLPFFIVEVNSANGAILPFEAAVDKAGEDFAFQNINVDYHKIENSGTYTSPIYRSFNHESGLIEDIYDVVNDNGLHASDWFSYQYTAPALLQWVKNQLGCGSNQKECIDTDFTNFENEDIGVWNLDGPYARRLESDFYSYSGSSSVYIYGNHENYSSISTDLLFLDSDFLIIDFHYYAYSMEQGDKFLLEIDFGSGYNTIKTFEAGVDFENLAFAYEEIEVNPYNIIGTGFSNNHPIKLRIRNQGDETGDFIVLDDIKIQACSDFEGRRSIENKCSELDNCNHSNIELRNSNEPQLNIDFFPNPTSDLLTIRSNIKQEDLTIRILNLDGRVVSQHACPEIENVISLSKLSSQIYILNIYNDNSLIQSKRIIKI